MNTKNEIRDNLNIVLLQYNVQFGNIERNFEIVENYLSNFSFENQESYLIMLPELFATGYDLTSINENAMPIKESKIIKFLSDIAIKHHTYVYTSFPEKEVKDIYNTAILIDSQGNIVDKYRKIHLFLPLGEGKVFTPGNQIVTVKNFHWGNLGLSICYDLRFSELYVQQRNDQVNIFLLCAEWPLPRIDHWKTLIQARAIEHQTYIIAINRVGEDQTGVYGGNSMIVGPTGEIIEQLNSHEKISVNTLSFENISVAKKLFDVRKERKI